MINPINNYALTSGQPGVINEEAYTTLELVGVCGAKVNECIAAVNANTQAVEAFDTRLDADETAIEAAQSAADGAQNSITNINSRNGYTYNVFALNDPILNIKEPGGDEYKDVFIEYINEFIAKVLNDKEIYFNFETFRSSNPITVHVAWGDANNAGNLTDICVTGTLDFSIFVAPVIEVLGPEKPLITWQFTQTPVTVSSEAHGTIDAIYANGCTFFEIDNYSADNPYDGQLFRESVLGAFIDNVYQI